MSMQKSRSKVKTQGHTGQDKFCRLGVFGPYLQFVFTVGYEMMYKAWGGIKRCPIVFSKSSIKFQGHTGKQQLPNLTRIQCFWTVTPVWIHRLLRNDAQSLKCHRRGGLKFFKIMRQIVTPTEFFKMITTLHRIHKWLAIMHTAWGSIEDILYCFSRRLLLKLHAYTGGQPTIWPRWKRFRMITPIWINGLL